MQKLLVIKVGILKERVGKKDNIANIRKRKIRK
jgi:hypothetical protein